MAAGFKTAQAAADSMGIKYPTYAGHENGTTGLRLDVAASYAKKFKVSIDWLATGRGKGPRSTPLDSPADWRTEVKDGLQSALDAGADQHEIVTFVVDETIRLLAELAHSQGADVRQIVEEATKAARTDIVPQRQQGRS